MAKAKSGSGSKTTRNNKQETNTNNPVVTPGVESPTPEMTAAAKNVVASKPPETKIAEPRAEARMFSPSMSKKKSGAAPMNSTNSGDPAAATRPVTG
jgi:hypothetical protein